MATKNATAGNRSTVTENAARDAAGVAVGARPPGAAGAVWDALTANPGATVAAIVAGSGVSKAMVSRVLSTLEGEGRAVRTRGGRDGGRRLPDIWTAVAPDDAPGAAADDAAPDTATPSAAASDVTATDDADAAPAVEPVGDGADAPGDVAGAAEIDGAAADEAAADEAREALSALGAAVTAALEALDAGDAGAALSAAELVYSGSGKARRLVRTVVNGRPRTGSGRPRSAPGEMRAKVAAHLTAHPGTEFTPHEIAKVIGHSAGAVSNALDRLVEAGEAELVCDRPRRFTAVRPADTAAR